MVCLTAVRNEVGTGSPSRTAASCVAFGGTPTGAVDVDVLLPLISPQTSPVHYVSPWALHLHGDHNSIVVPSPVLY